MFSVGPVKMGDGRKVGPKLMLLSVEAGEPRHRGMNARVYVHRYNKCLNPHGGEIVPRCSPWVMKNYVFNKCSEIPPPFHLMTDDVTAELDTHRVTPQTRYKHDLGYGMGGTPIFNTLFSPLARVTL